MSNNLREQADYAIHSGWGDHINWLVSDWNSVDFNKDILSVHGHLSSRPSLGQTLYGEFQHSHILFEFVEVEYKFDPPDMFFAKVIAIKQEMK